MAKISNIFLLILTIVTADGWAETVPDKSGKGNRPLPPAKVYIIGVEASSNFPDYAFGRVEGGAAVANKKEDRGAAGEILERFAQETGTTFEYRVIPKHKLDTELQAGRIDLRFPDQPSSQLNLEPGLPKTYSLSLFDATEGLMVAQSNQGMPREKLKKIATVKGLTAWQFLDDVKSGKIQLVESSDAEGALNALLKGSVSAAYINIAVANYHLRQKFVKENGQPPLIFDSSLPHASYGYQISTIKFPEIIRQFDSYLAKQDSEISKILNKYGILTNKTTP